MLRTHRVTFFAAGLPLLAAGMLFFANGSVRAPAQWNLLALATDACIAVMAVLWLLVVLGSRPAGRATALLALGLGGLMLGAWCGCLQQVFEVEDALAWAAVLAHATTLVALVCLAWGLFEWRRAPAAGAAPGQQRLLRDHPSLDPLTQVGDADHLREQLALACKRNTANCALLMLDVDRFHDINREHGPREGDRLLQAISQVMQLNLRRDDLLCRYAGDRFAVLLTATSFDTARELAEQLRRAVGSLRHHGQRDGAHLQVTLRYVLRPLDTDPRQLLKEANRALERRMPRASVEPEHLSARTA